MSDRLHGMSLAGLTGTEGDVPWSWVLGTLGIVLLICVFLAWLIIRG